MNETYITTELLAQYAQQLYEEEKSSATIEKYIRDVRTFSKYAGSQALTKDLTIAYKRDLPTRGYTILSVNSMLASLNSFLVFCGRADCKVKLYRVQKKTYLAANRELSKAEYQRLLHAARKDQRLWLLLQTLCATGIRVSELQYFTVEAVRAGEISVACKSKTRSILIPRGLQKLLLQYEKACKHQENHSPQSPVSFVRHAGNQVRTGCAACSGAGLLPKGATHSGRLPSFYPAGLLVGVPVAAALRLAVYVKGKNAKKFRKNMEYGSARCGA